MPSTRNQKDYVPPETGRGSTMTPKMANFCREYMIDFNATDAYIRAGYQVKSRIRATRNSTILMKHPLIKTEIERLKDERLEKSELSVDYVVNKLIARAEAEGASDQNVLRALELLGRHLGMFRDKQEISGPDGSAIQVQEQKVQENAADFTRRISSLAARGGKGEVVEFPRGRGTGET